MLSRLENDILCNKEGIKGVGGGRDTTKSIKPEGRWQGVRHVSNEYDRGAFMNNRAPTSAGALDLRGVYDGNS